eukprot:TRINITY_DN97379_c0_g1_i1.p1 TRINITY_DN97379_c0_g1~~TRINITY_DN97379_c0_g1_i1.p1  ORF type:complete len:275 (+),score=-8.81 TRINITY_DN97379_c0_g1_i1:64-888(+)
MSTETAPLLYQQPTWVSTDTHTRTQHYGTCQLNGTVTPELDGECLYLLPKVTLLYRVRTWLHTILDFRPKLERTRCRLGLNAKAKALAGFHQVNCSSLTPLRGAHHAAMDCTKCINELLWQQISTPCWPLFYCIGSVLVATWILESTINITFALGYCVAGLLAFPQDRYRGAQAVLVGLLGPVSYVYLEGGMPSWVFPLYILTHMGYCLEFFVLQHVINSFYPLAAGLVWCSLVVSLGWWISSIGGLAVTVALLWGLCPFQFYPAWLLVRKLCL